MDNLFLIIFAISMFALAFFAIRTIISIISKDKMKRKTNLKRAGISAAVMFVSVVGFGITSPSIDGELAAVDKPELTEEEKAEITAKEVEVKKKADEEKVSAALKAKEAAEAKEKADAEKKDNEVAENNTSEVAEVIYQPDAVANAEKHPAKPGVMLYDKTDSKFKGMNYHFKGTLVKIEKVEGLFGNMEDALLVKNEQGYVMPIFPLYEISVAAGDQIEVWGPLSGDGYASSDLGVDNVVGMTGAMNATRIDVNGEMQ